MTPAQFRDFMEKHGLTYEAVRRDFGYSPATISKYRDDATGELPKDVDLAVKGWVTSRSRRRG